MKSAISRLILRSGAALPILALCAAQARAQTAFDYSNFCGNGLWTWCCGNGLPCGEGGAAANNWSTFVTCPCPPNPGLGDTVHVGTPINCNGGQAGILTVDAAMQLTHVLEISTSAVFNGPIDFGGTIYGGGIYDYNAPVGTTDSPSGSRDLGVGVHRVHDDLTINAGFGLGVYGEVICDQTLTWNGDQVLYIDGAYSPTIPGGIVRIQPTGTFLVTGDGEAHGIIGLGYIYCDGLFRKNGGIGTTSIASRFHSTGNLQVQTGTLRLTGPDNRLSGTVAIASGSLLEIAGNATTLGNVSISGPGLLAFSGGYLGVESGATANVARLRVYNSYLLGPGSLIVSGDLHARYTTLQSAAHIIIAPGATAAFEEADTKLFENSRFINRGQLNWSAGNLTIDSAGSLLSNEPGGIIDLQGDASIGALWEGPGQFVNHGTFRKSAGAGLALVGVPMLNTGTIEINSGRMGFSALTQTSTGRVIMNNAILDQYNGGVAFPLAAGRLEGTGVVWRDVSNTGGTLAPGNSAGILRIGVVPPSDYSQGVGGTLEIEIGGTSPGAGGYDQLLVDWQATLGGTLNVSLINGFTPSEGQAFYILVAGSRSGEFSTVNIPPGMVIQYTPTEVILIMPASCDPDVNCDGSINGFDIEATEQAINGDYSNFCQSSADLNNDGAENGFDIETEEQRVNGAPC